MSNYKGHVAGGVAAYCCLAYVMSGYMLYSMQAVEWLLCTLLGALFPDIDTKSTGQKLVYRILFITMLVLIMRRLWPLVACLSLISLVPPLTRHRGMFHSPWFLIASTGCMMLVSVVLFPKQAQHISIDLLFFLAGLFSHLILDFGFFGVIRKL